MNATKTITKRPKIEKCVTALKAHFIQNKCTNFKTLSPGTIEAHLMCLHFKTTKPQLREIYRLITTMA